MFEFAKLYGAFERSGTAERTSLLTERSSELLNALSGITIGDTDAVTVLAGFIVGSFTFDGKIRETEYLMIYPTLACVFGDDFDFTSIKEKFGTSTGGKRAIADYTEKMQCLLSLTNSDMKRDIIMLCLCIVSVDGKVSLKEKYYIRQLCDA